MTVKVIKSSYEEVFETRLNNALNNSKKGIKEVRTFGSDGYIIGIIFYEEKKMNVTN